MKIILNKKLSNAVCALIFIGFFAAEVTFANLKVPQTQTKTRSAARQTSKPSKSAVKPKRRKRTFIEVASIPTPMETVTEMLRLANLKKGDILYDLGSGDGRIPLEAAKTYGVRAIGIEIKPKLVDEANERARQEGVGNLAKFLHADMFRMSYRDAAVVTLYLSDELNLRLLPKLLRELRPGARIVSHDFRMGNWQPEISVKVPWKNLYRNVHVWTVPKDKNIKNLMRKK